MHPLGAPHHPRPGPTRLTRPHHPFPDLALPTLLNSLDPLPLRALRAGHCPSPSSMQATKLTVPECTASVKSSGAAPHHPLHTHVLLSQPALTF